MRRLQFALLALVTVVPISVQAQVFPEANGSILSGVTAVDARVVVTTWLNVEGDRHLFEENAQSAFELGLRRDGVRVEVRAPNYLHCEVSIAQSSGLVAYHWAVKYYAFESAGLHRLEWETGGIVTVGRNNFEHQGTVRRCLDGFANEWLKWNPRR